jgi:hypothetical protein
MTKDKDLDLKELTNVIKDLIKIHGLAETHNRIKEDYKFHPRLRNTMLFILYEKYHFYKFENKEKLKDRY